jgi:hypothetical protein
MARLDGRAKTRPDDWMNLFGALLLAVMNEARKCPSQITSILY